jgi:hypothetical protein
MQSCLAPASEVAGGHAINCFKIGRPYPFLNGKVCPPETSEAGAKRPAMEVIFKCCLKFGTTDERIARKIRPIPHNYLRDL